MAGRDKPATPPEGEPRTDDVAVGRWVHADALTTAAEGPGTRLGPYKLLQQLGQGGMGAVWVAEQHEPVQRRVALKVIKPGLDSARVLARFEQERQALSLMDHPHIARILDAGATAAGRPFFVMELVKGVPITQFCDRERLTLRQRLELFVPVCQAVQHAHTKGILHRDLKPSNVLVALYDGKAVPKVIDFGLAKALHQHLTEQTVYTEVGQVVGTLEYMAPEQAECNNLDIDTRADVYSLGVLLYELLTGGPPFPAQQLRGVAFPEALRILREVEPPKPSTRLSSSAQLPAIAAQRQQEPAKLAKLVRGELDWIVMKCLEKERGPRYETANGLAMDVQRYLADEPVLAGPPSARYRLRKFLRKYRGPVAAAAVVALLLVAGIIGTTAGFVRAERQRSVAQQEKARAEASQRQAMAALAATTDDVVGRLIGSKPALGPSERAFMKRALERWRAFAAEQGEGELARSIRGEGAFRVAYLQAKLSQWDEAVRGFREAITLWEKLAAEFPAVPAYRQHLAGSHNNLGNLLANLGKRPEAEASHRRALELQQKLTAEFPAVPEYAQDLATSHNNLGNLLMDLGQRPEAEEAYRRALDLKEQLAAEFPAVPAYRQDLATSHNNLGLLLAGMGKATEAEAAYRRALNLRDILAAEFPAVPQYRTDLGGSQGHFGDLLRRNQQPQQALDWFNKAITTLDGVRRQTPGDVTILGSLRNAHWGRAQTLDALKRHAEAVADWDKAVELSLRQEQASLRLSRVLSRVRAGQVGPALREVEELANDADADTLYNAACAYSLASAAAPEQKDSYTRRALELLRQSVAKGYKDVKKIKQDEDLNNLRGRDDFRKLVAEIDKPSPPQPKTRPGS
jgi:serine/threonine protein kinase